MQKWEADDRDPTMEPTEKPKPRMHPDDANNFLKLAAALKIILGRTVQCADLPRAERLLKEYLEGYLSVSLTLSILRVYLIVLPEDTSARCETQPPLGFTYI